MNGRKIIETVFLILSLAAVLWLVTTVTTLPGIIQVVLLVMLIMGTTIYFVYPTLPFDFKFLALLLLGCALLGKGFSYLSPVEPIYIAEVTLMLCLVGMLLRWLSGQGFVLTPAHGVVFIWMAVVGCYLFDGFPKFGKLALRDSAMGYYGLFFFAAFTIFQRERAMKAFGTLVRWMLLFGWIGAVYLMAMAHFGPLSWPMAGLVLPQPDTYLPLISGFAATCFILGAARKKPVFFVLGIAATLLLLGNKTAGIFSFGCVMLFLVIFARRIELLVAGLATGVVAVLVSAIMISAESKFFEEVIMKSDQVQTVIDVGDAGYEHGSGNDSTSDWRVTWWKFIIADTMAESPMFGMGLGADITGHFTEMVLGRSNVSDYARYPHSILFTVFGRMGFLGLAVFLGYFGFVLVFAAKFARRHFVGGEIDTNALVIFSVFLGGLANSLVQATYEAPYAAVQHWVCLAYLVAYHHRYGRRPRLLVLMESAPSAVVAPRRERRERPPVDGERAAPRWTADDCANRQITVAHAADLP
jgi:hypothetical protein